jgi:hypothetical protein
LADYRAILAVSDAIRGLLHSSYRRELFDNTPLEFEVYTTRDFTSRGLENGITLFLYRIFIQGSNRIAPGRIGSNGRRQRPQLPLELHYLVTVWARQHTLQHSLAAWTMRTLEDNALLSSGVLNAGGRDVFRPDETVEIALAEMRTEDLFRIWEVLGPSPYHLSIPYLARVVSVESIERMPAAEGPPVQERELRAGPPERGEEGPTWA